MQKLNPNTQNYANTTFSPNYARTQNRFYATKNTDCIVLFHIAWFHITLISMVRILQWGISEIACWRHQGMNDTEGLVLRSLTCQFCDLIHGRVLPHYQLVLGIAMTGHQFSVLFGPQKGTNLGKTKTDLWINQSLHCMPNHCFLNWQMQYSGIFSLKWLNSFKTVLFTIIKSVISLKQYKRLNHFQLWIKS